MNRSQAERAVLEVLADNPGRTLHRLEIGAEVFARTGGTFLASTIGGLLNRRLISRPQPDPGPKVHRYAITDAGVAALELADLFEAS